MSDYLGNLIARATGRMSVIQPRLPMLFEPLAGSLGFERTDCSGIEEPLEIHPQAAPAKTGHGEFSSQPIHPRTDPRPGAQEAEGMDNCEATKPAGSNGTITTPDQCFELALEPEVTSGENDDAVVAAATQTWPTNSPPLRRDRETHRAKSANPPPIRPLASDELQSVGPIETRTPASGIPSIVAFHLGDEATEFKAIGLSLAQTDAGADSDRLNEPAAAQPEASSNEPGVGSDSRNPASPMEPHTKIAAVLDTPAQNKIAVLPKDGTSQETHIADHPPYDASKPLASRASPQKVTEKKPPLLDRLPASGTTPVTVRSQQTNKDLEKLKSSTEDATRRDISEEIDDPASRRPLLDISWKSAVVPLPIPRGGQRTVPLPAEAGPNPGPKMAPTIHVTIGRIEVKNISSATSPLRKISGTLPITSLTDYLKERNGARP